MDRHGASEAKRELEAGTSFYFEEEIFLKVSPNVGRRSALDRGLSHAFCRIWYSHFSVAAREWHGEG